MVLAFGIAMTVSANVIMNSGEAFIKAITDRFKKEFGTIKIIFNISCVTISIQSNSNRKFPDFQVILVCFGLA